MCVCDVYICICYIQYTCTLANLIVEHPRRHQGVYILYSENRKSRGIYLFIFTSNPPLPFYFD